MNIFFANIHKIEHGLKQRTGSGIGTNNWDCEVEYIWTDYAAAKGKQILHLQYISCNG